MLPRAERQVRKGEVTFSENTIVTFPHIGTK